MLITKQYVKDLLRNKYPSVTVLQLDECVFDNTDFVSDDSVLYLGVLNCHADTVMTNYSGDEITIVGATNPVLFRSVAGDNVTFIGFRIKIAA